MNLPDLCSPPNRFVRLMLPAGVVLVFLFIAACGKKGPLYLPDDAGPPGKTGGQVTTPAPDQPLK